MTGFGTFQDDIRRVVEDLGGSPAVTKWVSSLFVQRLYAVIVEATGERFFSAPRHAWTTAAPAHFEAAAGAAVLTLGIGRLSLERVESEAVWEGATLRRRGNGVWVEGRCYRLLAGVVASDSRYDSRKRAAVEIWRSHITRDAVDVLPHNGMKASAQTATEAAGIKSLERIIGAFFGVELRGVAQ